MNLLDLAIANSMGREFPSQVFFRPNKEFYRFIESYINQTNRRRNTVIYDVGCGMGHVASQLHKLKYNIVAMDLHERAGQWNRVKRADGGTYDYQSRSVVLLCRPNHGFMIDRIIGQAFRCLCSVIYVGLPRNIEEDLSGHGFRKVLSNAGADGEEIWISNGQANMG